MMFRKNQHVVKAHSAKEQLMMGYKVLRFSQIIIGMMQRKYSG
jgi:hypothetical protein